VGAALHLRDVQGDHIRQYTVAFSLDHKSPRLDAEVKCLEVHGNLGKFVFAFDTSHQDLPDCSSASVTIVCAIGVVNFIEHSIDNSKARRFCMDQARMREK